MLIKQSTAKTIVMTVRSITTGQLAAGQASSTNLSKNGAALVAGPTMVEIGVSGVYTLGLSASDTNTIGHLGIAPITSSGYYIEMPEVQIVPFDPESATNLGLSTIATSTATLATSAALTAFTGGGTYTAPDNASITAIKAKTDNLPSAVKKNTAYSNFHFLMVSSTTHLPATGLTVTGNVVLDNGVLTPLGNPVVEIGSGLYRIDLTSGELNGNSVTLVFTATGADPRYIPILTKV